MICNKCKITMEPGIYTKQTWVPGIPDFIGDDPNTGLQTMHAGGKGKIGQCLKCPECGYSITDARGE